MLSFDNHPLQHRWCDCGKAACGVSAASASCGTAANSPGLHTLSSDKYPLRRRCVIVTKLPVTYRLPTASGVTISQPQRQAAALQDNDLYVEVDRLDSYTHILPELTRLFNDGVKDPDMAQFLITLILTMVRVTPHLQSACMPAGTSQWYVSHHFCRMHVYSASMSACDHSSERRAGGGRFM